MKYLKRSRNEDEAIQVGLVWSMPHEMGIIVLGRVNNYWSTFFFCVCVCGGGGGETLISLYHYSPLQNNCGFLHLLQ